MIAPAPGSGTTSVLFVCLGNICRSPLAEGVFRDLVRREGLEERFTIDSAGTGAWHVGDAADPRSIAVARENGITLEGCARQVEPGDLRRFDLVIAMDRGNLEDLRRMAPPGASARLHLLRDFDPEEPGRDVPDPYYGGPGGFQTVYDMVLRSCRALLEEVRPDRVA